MATRRALTQITGVTRELPTGDTFDPLVVFGAPLDVAYGATVALDLSTAQHFTLTRLVGPAVITFTNAAPGRSGTVTVRQDNTAGRAVSFVAPSGYVYVRDALLDALVASTAAAAVVEYAYRFYALDGIKMMSIRATLVVDQVTPSTILGSKCVLDLDSDRGLTFGAGGGVAQWNDQSPQGNHFTQATLGSQPALNTGTLRNGRKGVTLHPTFMSRASFAGIAAGAHPYVYLLWNPDGGIFFYYQRQMLAFCGVSVRVDYLTVNAAPAAGFTAGVLTRPALLVVRYDADATRVEWNNVQVSTGAAAALTASAGFALAENSSGDPWTAYRLVVTSDAPTAAEHAAMVEYFRSQYPAAAIAA